MAANRRAPLRTRLQMRLRRRGVSLFMSGEALREQADASPLAVARQSLLHI
jgi:hypothetical protein